MGKNTMNTHAATSQLSQATGLNAARTHLDISWLYMVECDELQRQSSG